ncbi:LPS O-antigen length regulator Wzz(fepE) [Pseudescherichia sp.]|jgi:LPS O-antigen subunit length determinant protein (WzzB/FepE family)|uniref:LPS O-antigen length regulator Wzz(fepE) n=1 Tax=Pseudescherichia sp. TaxID=2055881 RepID=UPI000E8563AF|nr:LPS O-antigen length regulator Wzz(fepE) [Pseudescherichia sp.]HAZ75196.1 LPS O-antigen length regulator [Enterobacteriaceae bacterium]
MSTLDIKQDNEVQLRSYPVGPHHAHEIDFLTLLDVLWAAKKQIIVIAAAFALLGLLISFVLPQKWTSEAIITPAEQTQWRSLQQTLMELQVLDIDVAVTPVDVFGQFIKNFSSQSLQEEYFRSSPYVKAHYPDLNADSIEFQRAVVRLTEKLKIIDNASPKSPVEAPFTSWTLSFSASTPEDAKEVLEGYVDYVAAKVVNETTDNIRNTLSLKTRFEQEKLNLDRVRLTNQRDIKIQRLNYSLEVANAAGIKKPVYSNGQVVNDDPDFSITLGADGIQEKLRIEKSLKDIADLNADLRNREYHVEQLQKLNVKDIAFSPFKYQLSPSLPMKKDGQGKAIITVLMGLVGGIIACGVVLLRNAMLARSLPPVPPEMVLESA